MILKGRTLDVYLPLEKSREELSRVIGIIRVIVLDYRKVSWNAVAGRSHPNDPISNIDCVKDEMVELSQPAATAELWHTCVRRPS
jgi:hypothetical protein